MAEQSIHRNSRHATGEVGQNLETLNAFNSVHTTLWGSQSGFISFLKKCSSESTPWYLKCDEINIKICSFSQKFHVRPHQLTRSTVRRTKRKFTFLFFDGFMSIESTPIDRSNQCRLVHFLLARIYAIEGTRDGQERWSVLTTQCESGRDSFW